MGFEEKIKKQYVEGIYEEVVKSFPDVKEDEIEITYEPFLRLKVGYTSLNITRTKKEPRIYIGPQFFCLTKEEQEAVIAHEIGHHKVMKHFSIPRLKRIPRRIKMYNINNIPASRPHWKERLEKFFFLTEIAADNQVAETKYGKHFLQYYKKYLNPSNEIHQAQIKNLERKLRSA